MDGLPLVATCFKKVFRYICEIIGLFESNVYPAMKVKASKKGSGNGPKNLNFKGVKKPTGGFKKGKKSKRTLKRESTAINHKTMVIKKEKVDKDSAIGEKGNMIGNGAHKKKQQQAKFQRRKVRSTDFVGSSQKRESEDDNGQVKKKLRVKKEDEIQRVLDKKNLKVARRKRKHSYQLTVSLIKKYDGLRR